MQKKFNVRLIYLAVGILVIWVVLVGAKVAPVLSTPVPVVIDASAHGGVVHFEADRSTVVFNSDCVTVSWHTDNIKAVFLGEDATVGEGTKESCDGEPRLHIVFKDGSDETYVLPQEVVFDFETALLTLAIVIFAAYLLCAYFLVSPAENNAHAIPREEIRPLTSLRALAALAVFFYHWSVPAVGLIYTLQLKWVMGVTVFFVLSGFLIASRYMDEIINRTFRWRPYLIRRAARILPLYYALVIIVALWHEPFGLANLTLTQSFFPDLWKSGIPPAWTLTLEESFYLLLPLILWLCFRTKRPWWALAAVVVSSYVIGHLLVAADLWPLSFMLIRTIFGRMIDFMIGVGCAFVYRRWQPGKRAALLTVVCCIGFFGWLLLLAHTSEDVTLVYGDWAIALLAGGLILSLTAESGWIVRLLSWRPLVYAGRISYAFYLFHFTAPTKELYGTLLPLFGDLTSFVLLGIVAVICIGLYEVIEKPAHAWILRRFNATGSPVAASVQSL